jgi:ribosome-associated toxin RatA of RatAB toxin-antitoxin module
VAATSRSVDVPAEPGRVLAVVLDLAEYPQWQKDIRNVEVLTSDERGRPQRATMSIAAMGFRGHYTVDYSYPSDTTVEYHLVESDMMSRNDARFDAVAGTDGTTRLTVTMDLALVWPMPRPVVDRLVKRGVENALAAIAARAQN